MTITVKPGEKLPLSLLLFDGDETKYPSAYLYGEDFAPVSGSPFPLTHLAHGLYKNNAVTATGAQKLLTAVYVVFSDPARSQISETYTRSEDKFLVQDLDQYTQKMSTTLSADGTQEVIVWAERNGERLTSTGNCSLAVKDSLGIEKWAGQLPAPNSDGVFRFRNPILAVDNSNYYVVISMELGGRQRVSQQAFMAIG